eukprot:758174-Amphidinium_carterae.1
MSLGITSRERRWSSDAIVGLKQLDRHLFGHALQCPLASQAWRADVRLSVFGLWVLCHFIYMVLLQLQATTGVP